MALSFIAKTILEYGNMLEKQYSDMFFLRSIPLASAVAESEGLLTIMPHRRDSAILVMLPHPCRCHRLASVLSTAPWYI